MQNNSIIILPEFIANQIAAGEVVQRPESVVKELVENSLDAGATEIVVIIHDGGKQLINVIDNGSGMVKEDLLLSIRRHATSKIKSQEDLERILTFGFRGEALASISSVSDIEIRTKHQSEKHGWRLRSEPTKQPIIEPFNLVIGTQIYVRNLFYNVPARKKFMKSKISEIRYISDSLMRIALVNPEIRFTFYSDDNLVFDVKPSSWKQRIIELLGNSAIDGFMEVAYENELLKLSGYIAKPELARPTTSGQFLFVNRRPVESRNLSFAIFSAFENLLERNLKPVYLLNLTIDPDKIDVNVHPQKNEVKFDNENYVYNTLRKAVALTLENNNLITNIDIQKGFANQPFVRLTNEANKSILVNQVTGEVVENDTIPTKQADYKWTNYNSDRILPKNPTKSDNFDWNNYQKLVSSSNAQSNELTNPSPINIDNNKSSFFENDSGKVDDFSIQLDNSDYWQIFNKYIIVHLKDRIILVDQHNAHERILYEQNLKKFDYSKPSKLLFESKFNLSPSEVALVGELQDELREIGFDIKINEPNEVVVISVPDNVSYGEEESVLRKIIDEYNSKYSISNISNKEKMIASISCKAAIKTGESLSFESMKRLVIDLFKCQNPYLCPHGRPIILDMKLSELDRQFGRSYKINEIP